MQEFDDAKKIYLDAKGQHDELLKGLDKLLAGESLTAVLSGRDKNAGRNVRHRAAVRKLTDEIAASEEILSQTKRRYAHAINTRLAEETDFASIHEKIIEMYWALALSGTRTGWGSIAAKHLKAPPDSKLYQERQKFLNKFDF
jgi:hypothetical protein